jgi:hypothetical protein
MNRAWFAVLTAALLCGSLMAQTPETTPSEITPSQAQTPATEQPASPTTTPSANTAPRTSAIAPGSVLPVQLTKSVDAKKAKKGDEVVAKVTQDLRNNAGTVIVPKDTKVVGHITEAQARSKEQKESQLAIAFDHAVMKNGEAMQMPMSIQAIIAPPNRNADNAGNNAEPTPGQTAPSSSPAARQGSMGGAPSPTASAPQSAGSAPADARAQTSAQPQITGETQGVVGIANLKLSTEQDATQGSVVSSEKNNVKLDDGTFMLLRVSH